MASWGGHRIGAGRKAKSNEARWLEGDSGKRGKRGTAPAAPEASVTAPDVDLEPPAMLTADEQAYWHLWAPLAAENGTLNTSTRPGLVLLCQVARRSALLWAQIEADGVMYDRFSHDFSGQAAAGAKQEPAIVMDPKAHPLLAKYISLVSRQEQLLARYGLAGSGKAVESKPKAATVDPFEAHQRRGGLRAVTGGKSA